MDQEFLCILQEDAMKSDKNVVMKPNGRRYSTSEWGDSISAACAGFGVHISMSE